MREESGSQRERDGLRELGGGKIKRSDEKTNSRRGKENPVINRDRERWRKTARGISNIKEDTTMSH